MSFPKIEDVSPMMQEYLRTKQEHPECLLFYRLGDFYEMFFDDAEVASKELELTLTGKSCGLNERAPMCGIPFHAVDIYIAKLVEKGYRVAICEQVEDPRFAKGLVKREVTMSARKRWTSIRTTTSWQCSMTRAAERAGLRSVTSQPVTFMPHRSREYRKFWTKFRNIFPLRLSATKPL